MENHPLIRAKEIIDKIYEYTEKVVLTGEKEHEDSETEYYANLMDLREPLVAELGELREKIDPAMKKSKEFAALQKTLEDIRQMDLSHIRYIEHIRSSVQNSFKDVKQGQKINSAYQAFNDESGSHMFDKKQ